MEQVCPGVVQCVLTEQCSKIQLATVQWCTEGPGIYLWVVGTFQGQSLMYVAP